MQRSCDLLLQKSQDQVNLKSTGTSQLPVEHQDSWEKRGLSGWRRRWFGPRLLESQGKVLSIKLPRGPRPREGTGTAQSGTLSSNYPSWLRLSDPFIFILKWLALNAEVLCWKYNENLREFGMRCGSSHWRDFSLGIGQGKRRGQELDLAPPEAFGSLCSILLWILISQLFSEKCHSPFCLIITEKERHCGKEWCLVLRHNYSEWKVCLWISSTGQKRGQTEGIQRKTSIFLDATKRKPD